MFAVIASGFGDASVLKVGEVKAPTPNEGELLVRVHATALNRADLLQRRGLYPPPPGAPEILGLEMAGVVEQVPAGCSEYNVGDRVCALLPGGGYAEYVTIPTQMAIPIPQGLSFEEAAAVPEVFLTAYLNLFWLGGLTRDSTVLIHAGASGVGTAAIQLVREVGARALVTAGSAEKIERCLKLGATGGWNYKEGGFASWALEKTEGKGVNLILDFVGAPYFEGNLQALAMDGRLVVIGTMGGTEISNFNLGKLMAKRLQVIGTTLRNRKLEDKIRLTKDFCDFALPRFEDGRLKPIVDSVFEFNEVAKAHEYMESNANIGKIVLRIP